MPLMKKHQLFGVVIRLRILLDKIFTSSLSHHSGQHIWAIHFVKDPHVIQVFLKKKEKKEKKKKERETSRK